MQLLLNGLVGGLAIAVLALAFQLIYLPTKIFYFAMAAIYAAAPFPAWQLLQWGVPAPLALFSGVLTGAMLAIATELLTHRKMARGQGSFSAQFIASLGYYIVIVQIIAVIWGNEPKLLRSGIDPVLDMGGVILTYSRLWQMLACVAMISAFFCWLQFTQVGLQFRALSDNPRELAMRGYNIDRLRVVAFGLSGAIIGAMSVLSGLDSGFYSYSGLPMFLLAVVAAIIGGRYSFFGAVIGGVFLGLIRAEVEWNLSLRWLNIATFLLLVLFLLFRPQGILAKRKRLESEASG